MANSENNNSNGTEESNLQEKSVESANKRPASPDAFVDSTLDAVSEGETLARDIKEGRLSCYIGSGTSLTGELSFRAMARVDGHLTGKVKSEKGTLVIGASGQVDASVWVATAIINGTVNGDITTAEHLELKRTAKIVGNIRTPRLIMEDGALLEGNCGMLKAEEKSETANAKRFEPTTAAATAATAAPAASQPLSAKDNQAKDRKPFAASGKNEESSRLTLEVI